MEDKLVETRRTICISGPGFLNLSLLQNIFSNQTKFGQVRSKNCSSLARFRQFGHEAPIRQKISYKVL